MLDKQNADLIGHCGLRFLADTTEIELTYAIDRSYWRQGIATEAAAASFKYGFEKLNATQIIALAAPNNLVSQRVMQKIGMKFQKYSQFYQKDNVYYAITRQAWQR